MSLDLIKKVKPTLNEILAKFCFDTWSRTVEKPHRATYVWCEGMRRGGGGEGALYTKFVFERVRSGIEAGKKGF